MISIHIHIPGHDGMGMLGSTLNPWGGGCLCTVPLKPPEEF